MVKKTEHGRHILSASEVGGYTVCPEAWRLSSIENVRIIREEQSIEGEELHDEWARDYSEAAYIAKSARVLIALLCATIIIFLLTKDKLLSVV
jgi:hypothetical protein